MKVDHSICRTVRNRGSGIGNCLKRPQGRTARALGLELLDYLPLARSFSGTLALGILDQIGRSRSLGTATSTAIACLDAGHDLCSDVVGSSPKPGTLPMRDFGGRECGLNLIRLEAKYLAATDTWMALHGKLRLRSRTAFRFGNLVDGWT